VIDISSHIPFIKINRRKRAGPSFSERDAVMTAHAISAIDLWACTVPLPQPIDLGNVVLRERAHLAIRVTTADGLVADCVTQSRGSPLDMILADVIGPRMIGKDATDVPVRRAELQRQLTAMEFDGAIGRAWSALEICLQSLRAQALGIPLWQALGGRALPIPVELVEGYALADETDGAFAERLAARVAQGYLMLKIEAGSYADVEELARRLKLFRELAGPEPQLILDFAWSWTDAEKKRALVARVEEYGISWLEDPFPRTDIDGYAALRAFARAPIGCGDESTRVDDLRRLARSGSIDILRLDATTIGGIGAVEELVSEARDQRLRLSFHEHPEVHEHCVLGFDCSDHVEMFPTDRPFDQVHRLIEASAFERVSDGMLEPYDRPGIGMTLRRDGLEQFTRRHHRIEN
jgi:L-alanine-DL-glutamate epimerase-like enolase superfamily enzyme